jgi:hypothetical protein
VRLVIPEPTVLKTRWTSYRVSCTSFLLCNSSLTPHKAAGPFDNEDGDEAWRFHGTGVYTGNEFVKASRPSTTGEQARRQGFWVRYEAQSAVAAAQGQRRVLGQPRPAASEELRFPDALPTLSVIPSALVAQHHISALLPAVPSLPTPRASAPPSAATSASAPATVSAPAPTLSPPTASGPSLPHSSDVDGEYEIDDDYTSDAPQGPPAPTSANTVQREQVPRTSSPRAVEDWNDANLLTVWKHKVIRKKGYEPMLTSFENQTVESLHKAWTTHKERCKLLGAAWEAAGKPNGPLSEWFEE